MAHDIVSYTFTGTAPGPHLLVLGAVHGNEVCGTAALARLKVELELGLMTLTAGTLTIVPVCNPAAYRAGKRFIDANLNRIIRHWPQPEFPEQSYADQLATLIESADILLDLHSYDSGTIPYVFLDYPIPENAHFAASLGLLHSITGWPELYQAEADLTEGDTVLHAHRSGKMGLLVECGNHDDPASLAVATSVLRRALVSCGLIEGEVEALPQTIWRVERVVRRDETSKYSRPWQNLDQVSAGTPLIDHADGTHFNAPYDGVVILPQTTADVGHEWLYYGRRV